MKKSILYKFPVILVLILALISCQEQSKEDEHNSTSGKEEKNTDEGNHEEEVMLSAQQFEALQMKIDTISLRNMSGFVEANGELEVPPQNEAVITSVMGSNIASIEVIEGEQVKKNQVVAYLSHPNIVQKQTDYLNAYSNSEYLKKEYERQEKLYKAGVGSGMNFQKAEADYKAAKAMMQGLKAQLKQLNISTAGVQNGTIYQKIALKSPIEGFVQDVKIKTGQYVEPQTSLFEIVNTHHIHADLMVFEKDVNKVKKGQKIRFSIQSLPREELTAEIYSVGKTFEQNPKAVHVHAEIDNKNDNLLPGMYIQGRIEVENNKTQAFPVTAIAKEGGKSYVFTAEREGDAWSFKPLEVRTSNKEGDWIAVKFLEKPKITAKFAINNAYYLMAELKKGDAEHSH
ncbi:efflux RND transporter periplasmic adaptor subunit [Mesonia ostreae]|uniref:Efflux RND transporter periplasmic adaptor subunit n=1 Tax=Mesonia ostreae TaxID=861110 RepID=A0ABU2KJT7_9FLAO|nr:efflux RND transporter periplasmic adaptor subunit [Mesonia ostreae]MDT0294929.1 efflux RND transporter periplasmic adaptor subunit [Mesonia ostreae]